MTARFFDRTERTNVMTTSTAAGEITLAETAWRKWHDEREAALAVPQGWLSLVGFHWIPEQDGVLAGFPGVFGLRGAAETSVAVFTAEPGATVLDRVSGEAVGHSASPDIAEDGSVLWLEYDGVALELIRRIGRLAVRVRDPKAQTLSEFDGVPTFPFDPEWSLGGEFAAFPEPQTVTVQTALPGLVQEYQAIGTVRFELDGVPVRLLAYPAGGAADGSTGLSVLFHDQTNGEQTALWRSLSVPAPDSEGRITVDFNRAMNQPFAFSDFGTCPVPPAGNNVPARVTAGERTPTGRAATAGVTDPTLAAT